LFFPQATIGPIGPGLNCNKGNIHGEKSAIGIKADSARWLIDAVAWNKVGPPSKRRRRCLSWRRRRRSASQRDARTTLCVACRASLFYRGRKSNNKPETQAKSEKKCKGGMALEN